MAIDYRQRFLAATTRTCPVRVCTVTVMRAVAIDVSAILENALVNERMS
jgi:hypothetical protein